MTMTKTKRCPKCGKILPVEDFFKYKLKLPNGEIIQKPNSYCKDCSKKNRKERYKRKFSGIGISTDYDKEGYPDEKTKIQVENLLFKVGCLYNEENGIWYKPGIKNPDGSWEYQKKKEHLKRLEHQSEIPKDIKEKLNNLKFVEDKIIFLVENKISENLIIDELGVSKNKISYTKRDYIKIDISELSNKSDIEIVRYLYKKGMKVKQITNYVSISKFTVYNLIGKYDD